MRLIPALVALIALVQPASGQVAVYPVNLDFSTEVEQGRKIYVNNQTQNEVSFIVYDEDFSQDTAGVHSFAPAGSTTIGCGERLRFSPDAFTIAPNTMVEVDVRVLPSEDMCRSVIWFQDTKRRQLENASVATRIGVKVYADHPNSVAKGTLTHTEIVEDRRDNHLLINARVTNTGTKVMRPAGKVVISASDGTVIQEERIPAFSVMPGSFRVASWPLPELDLTQEYVFTVLLDYGGERLLGARLVYPVP